MVWDFVREQEGRLWLEFLLPYAPELNPVEYLWSYWKQHELPNFCPQNLFGNCATIPARYFVACADDLPSRLRSGFRRNYSETTSYADGVMEEEHC